MLFRSCWVLHFCVSAFSSRGKWGPPLTAVRGPLIIAASPVAEHRLQTRRLSSCGSRAQPLRGMWDPPRPGLEPASPALAGRLPTAAPPGKPSFLFLNVYSPFHKCHLALNRYSSLNSFNEQNTVNAPKFILEIPPLGHFCNILAVS